ncbi:MAG: serine hydrolase, partial [Chitinophagaceae bacterium]|nr:serine hydrolase [Oligoflexus sp.]
SEQKSGFFTDFYVEAGRLNESSARYHYGNSTSYFDLASLTKPLVTGALVHSYMRKIGLSRSDALASWPDQQWQKNFSSDLMKLSVESLLSHRSGLPAWRNFWMNHLNEGPLPIAQQMNKLISDTFARIKPLLPAEDIYSDVGYLLLGYALEAASGQRLDDLWADYLQSLGLSALDLGYGPQLHQPLNAFIPSAHCAVRARLLQGEVHDENCAALGGIAGHAGLFGSGKSTGDYLRKLYQSNEGMLFLQANESLLKTHGFEGLSGLRRGAGTSAALFANGKGMGHLGFTGTAFWLDLPSKRYALFLTNRVISGRLNPHMTAVRRQVFGHLNELA